jgi:initiation factor 1A
MGKGKQMKVKTSQLRVVAEEGELYAVVRKNLGNSRIEVFCMDGQSRICSIAKKFRHFKRDNAIELGGWIMVGLRLWEMEGRNKCDLLEVYSKTEAEKLKKTEGNWKILASPDEGIYDAIADDAEIVSNLVNNPPTSTGQEEVINLDEI